MKEEIIIAGFGGQGVVFLNRRSCGRHRGPFRVGFGLGDLQRRPYVHVCRQRFGAQNSGALYHPVRSIFERPSAFRSFGRYSRHTGFSRTSSRHRKRRDCPENRGSGGALRIARLFPLSFPALRSLCEKDFPSGPSLF